MSIMRSNKWNIFLAIFCMLLSILFVATAIKPNESISREVSSIVAVGYFVSSILYFCTYAVNKKIEEIEKDRIL